MKGNIMDKKILLGGAAAIIMGVGIAAAPAQASINLSIGGEAKVTAGFSACGVTAPDALALTEAFEAISGTTIADGHAAFNTAVEAIETGAADATAAQDAGTNDTYYDVTDDQFVNNTAGVVDTDGGDTTLTAATGSLLTSTTDANYSAANGDILLIAGTDQSTFTYIADPCGNGVDRNGIDWGFGKKLTIDASGTLANGLGVSFSDELDLTDTAAETGAFSMTLDGNFGSLNFKEGGGDAVGKARVAGDADYDVNGTNLGFHGSKTTGHGGMGILWTAPSVGDLDLYVGWSPNSGGDGLDNAAYENTFSVAAVMDVSALTVGVGYATANATDGNGCAATAASDWNSGTMVALADAIYGGDYCGDQTLMHVAASMDAGEISLGAGYSVQDTDEADKTVMHIDASTSMGSYDLSLGYRQTTKDYELGNKEDKQSVIAAGISTALGDGLDLGLSLSSSNTDLIAANSTSASNGDDSLMYAEVSLTAGF
jgi:hypothetical protein